VAMEIAAETAVETAATAVEAKMDGAANGMHGEIVQSRSVWHYIVH
jgi:hypothetical protein